MMNPKQTKKIAAIIALVLVLAMVLTTVFLAVPQLK